MTDQEEIKKLKADVETLQKFSIDASNILWNLSKVVKHNSANAKMSNINPRELHLKTFIKPKIPKRT